MNRKQPDRMRTALATLCTAILLSICCPDAYSADTTLPAVETVDVAGGCFEMGDSFGDGGSDEKPLHEVCVDSFRLARHEVTQELWHAVMGSNPSRFRDNPRNPVENVSWNDAQEFINRLNVKSGTNWRLPTEAEWEFAARSRGLKQRFAGTSALESLSQFAWYEENSEEKPHPVGSRSPNGLGLYDMSGNVWEWCSDRYDRVYYRQSPLNNPKGDPFGINRVMRGGSATSKAGFLRVTYREYVSPGMKQGLYGLRLARHAAPAAAPRTSAQEK